ALPVLDHLLGNRDAKVRMYGVEVLLRLPSEKHVRLLTERLDDPHRDVRIKARRSLHGLAAKNELHDTVLGGATKVLAVDEWRSREQAIILLAQLDHKPAAPRLVELLEAHRPEVFVTAAWGLRKLAVSETLPAVLRHVRKELAQGQR